MKNATTYEAIKVSEHHKQKIIDIVVVEAPLQININKESYTVVMRTPGDDIELIRGLLFSEDIYKKEADLNINLIENTQNHFSTYKVTIADKNIGKGYLNKRSLLSVSSCGICGKKSIEDLTIHGKKLVASRQDFESPEIEKMFNVMKNNQTLFIQTGASHAAAIFNKKKQLISIFEDIGRHNAVDKSIGNLLIKKQLKEANYLLVSGRVSYEIVTKAFIAKIPIIIAVSGCSSLSIDFSKEFGITLIGFSRSKKMTIYA